MTLQQAFELAAEHHRAGRLSEAEQICRQILASQPNDPNAIYLLGMIAHHAGRNDVAVGLIQKVIQLQPGWPNAHNNLGNIFKSMGQIDQAIDAYRKAIVQAPGSFIAHSNLGVSFRDKGQLNEASESFRKAIALNPNVAELHHYLGMTLRENGQLKEAITACQQAVALKPGYVQAHLDLAANLRDVGRLDEAIAACRQTIQLSPNFANAHGNLGSCLTDIGQVDLAIAEYRQAIAIKPDYNIGYDNLLISLHYSPQYDARRIAAEHQVWNDLHAKPLARLIEPHVNDRDLNRRLRIGYVSADFRDHAVGRNLIPLFSRHDHQQFEIFAYAQLPRHDAMTDRFQSLTDVWRNIVGLSDEQLANQIRLDRIDILVDLSLHTGGNRLLVFARKPAPVQVTFAGYPSSTGLTAIDYRLSDPYLDPAGMDESVYSEKTVRLPHSFWCYDPMDMKDIAVNPPPALKSGVITFGCLNNFNKFNDDILARWAEVLRQVENSRLLLLSPLGQHRLRTLQRFGEKGIDPGRIEFVAHQARRNYLETYHRIDIGLDTFPYNGHTTSLDSFWMGVPVVTFAGNRAVARAGWCQLSNLGLTELAGETPEQFVRIAIELAQDLPRIEQLRSTLRRRMENSPLMDAKAFAQNIEAAYRQMWHTWCDADVRR